MNLTERVLAGDARAIARAISLIEDESDGGAELVRHIFSHTGRAYLCGITGAPGAGKSTLVDRLIAELRKSGKTVGVVAVDPTSPFSGGAILGDRVRMQAHVADPGVFIRSMATRGNLGGLARATAEAALVLDAAGRDIVLIETVGVGQDEVDIVRTADVSVVTLVPGSGDEVQALKAGIMEIADIFVVNKADREGADRTVASIEAMLSLETFEKGRWRPPIVKTEATTGKGVPELVAAIERFREHTAAQLGERRRARAEFRVRELLAHRFVQHVEQKILAPGEFAALLDRIAARETDPYSVVEDIVGRALAEPGLKPVTPGLKPQPTTSDLRPTLTERGPTLTERGPTLTERRPTLEGRLDHTLTERRPTLEGRLDHTLAERRLTLQGRLDHVGVAVDDIAKAIAFYRDALGLEVEPPEEVASQRVRAHFIPAGEAALELLEATSEDSPIAKYVAKRGPGLHHITLRVDDIHAALAAGVCVWVMAIFLSPALAFPVGHFICHQRPERSFFVGGQQMPVCARCTGLYVGAVVAVPFALALATSLAGNRARRVLGVAAIPTLITWALEFAGIVPFSNLSRFIAALPLGFAAAWLVFSAFNPTHPST